MPVDLEYLANRLDDECEKNEEFRTEVRQHLSEVAQWVAVRDALEIERQKIFEKKQKNYVWLVSTLLTVGSTVVAFLK